jgi:TonB family protein
MRALLAATLILAWAATAGAQSAPGPIDLASLTLRRNWAQRFEQADSLSVRHEENRPRKASFRSARPSQILQKDLHVDGRIRNDPTLAGFLAKALRDPATTVVESCPETLATDEIVIGIGEIVATFVPQRGSLHFTDARGRTAIVSPGTGGSKLLDMLARAIPKDVRLRKIVPCTALVARDATHTGSIVEIETLPKVVKQVPPIYPDIARKASVEGTVILKVWIDEKGEVARTVVTRSIPFMEDEAVRAVEQWRFKPAMANGKPIGVWIEVPVAFRLE